MAYGSKAFLVAICLTGAAAWAEQWEFTAKQDRLIRTDKTVTVPVTDDGVAGTSWDDIQQATLTPQELRILMYADSKWRAGRDRELTFEALPAGTAEKLYPLLRDKLGSRFIPGLAAPAAGIEWEIPVKLRSGFGGSEGVLAVSADQIIYRSPERDQSRTWRIQDIESVNSGGPYDLTITTPERQGLLRSGPTDFRFQLKRPMPEERYQALWRRVVRGKGLAILQGDTNK